MWVRDENDVWAPASVLTEPNDSRLRLEREDAQVSVLVRWKRRKRSFQIVELRVNNASDYPPLRNPDILVGLNDLTTLSYLHEPAGRLIHSFAFHFTFVIELKGAPPPPPPFSPTQSKSAFSRFEYNLHILR